MSVILHAANGVDENPLLLANARRVGPYLRSKFCRDGFAPIVGAEHDMNYILSVGVRHVSHLRCWPFYTLGTQRSRAGLTCDAPTALEEGGAEQSGQTGRFPLFILRTVAGRNEAIDPKKIRVGTANEAQHAAPLQASRFSLSPGGFQAGKRGPEFSGADDLSGRLRALEVVGAQASVAIQPVEKFFGGLGFSEAHRQECLCHWLSDLVFVAQPFLAVLPQAATQHGRKLASYKLTF